MFEDIGLYRSTPSCWFADEARLFNFFSLSRLATATLNFQKRINMKLDSPLAKFGHGIIHRKRSFNLLNVFPHIRTVGVWRARLGLQITVFPLRIRIHLAAAFSSRPLLRHFRFPQDFLSGIAWVISGSGPFRNCVESIGNWVTSDRDLGTTTIGNWVSPNRDLGESRARFGTPRYSSGIANRVSRNSSGTESLAPRSKLWLQTSDPRSTVAGLPLLAILTDYFTKTCSDSAEGFESRRPRLIREVYIADSNA